MTPEAKALLIGGGGVIASFAIAFGLYKLITLRANSTSPFGLGRKWFAWMVAIGTITTLPKFFYQMDIDSFAMWVLCITVFGGVAFFIGWTIGLLTIQKAKSTNLSVLNNGLREESSNGEQYYCFINEKVKGPFDPQTLHQMFSGSVIANDTHCCLAGTEGWLTYQTIFMQSQ